MARFRVGWAVALFLLAPFALAQVGLVQKPPDVTAGVQTFEGRPVYQIGGGVEKPVVVRQVDPEFSEKAGKKKRFSGEVEIGLIVDEKGMPQRVHVIHGVGLGLDEKAVECIRQWRWKPGTKANVPVAVEIQITFQFQTF